jgi:NAD(P)-dependent dehydrogenase (short-subunit alcohol dehydrogenase family)
LAEAGADVVLAARTAADLEQLAGAIRAGGGSAEPLVVDLLDTPAAQAAISAAGPFDILVNNAGTNRPKPFVEVTEEDYDVVIDINLRAAFFVAQAVAKGMIAAGRGGAILNMSSQMGHVGAANRTIYCASKWGLEGLTKALAVELAPHRIRVNAVAPTFIETPMTRPFFQNEAFKASVLSMIKLGRLGRVEDIMGAIVYLASDAAALVTGASLLVDGGWTAE